MKSQGEKSVYTKNTVMPRASDPKKGKKKVKLDYLKIVKSIKIFGCREA